MKAAIAGEKGVEVREVPTPEPAANEILIRVRASSLNRADLLAAQRGGGARLGLECAGDVEAVGNAQIGAPAPNGRAPTWTPEKSVEAMDRNGIGTAVTSISAPGIWFGNNSKARDLARACNEYSAALVRDYKPRFGMFAVLPLPDVDASLREIEHAVEVLKTDGIGLMTNHDGRYLGDSSFAPVLEELNRRKAVVYVHPTSVNCSQCMEQKLPASAIEFPFDTTRTITSLIYSGTLSRLRDIRFVFSHAGGTVPFLADRIARLAQTDERFRSVAPDGPMAELQRLHYDTALSANPRMMRSLQQLVSVEKILFGTDFPFAPESTMAASVKGLAALDLSASDLRAIERENALRLLPQLRPS